MRTSQKCLSFLLIMILALICAGASAEDTAHYSWKYYRPGNTGIQGDFNEAIWIGPDGDPYIGGYDPFFEEGGFAKFIQSENRWVNYSNVDYPVMGHPNDQGKIRVSDIVADPSGKLWMGTWRGAMRFDPVVGADSITRFGPANSQLTDGSVSDIDMAPDGTMWFANNGAARYSPATDTWTRWTSGNSFLSVQPKAGGGYLVWSSTRPPFQDFTFIFDSDTGQWTTIDVSNSNGHPGDVAGMPGKDCVDDAGNFWALRLRNPGDFDALDYRKPDGTWVTPPEPYSGVTFDIWAFKAYGAGQALLVDGTGQVWHFNGTAWSSLGVWRAGAFTNAIDIDAAGNVWVCGNGGAAKRDAQTGQWQRYRITNTANFDSFNRDLTIDPVNGYIYTGANAGSGVGGMVRFDGVRWTGWDQLTYGLGYDWPFPNDYCQALSYRPSNASVAVTPYWFYGIHEWNGSTFDMLRPSDGAKRMCEDSLGRLWAIGEYFNLSYYDGSVWTPVPITAWGQGIAKDPTMPGTVWASTGYEFVRTDGVYLFSRTIANFPELTDNTDQILGLAADANGFAWVGTTAIYDGPTGQNGALIHIDANTGIYDILRSAQGWPFPGVLVIPWAVTPDGRVWMVYDTYYPYTVRGLLWWDGTNVGTWPAPPDGGPQWGGLPHGQVEDLEVRIIPNGYELWMSCVSRGLAVLTVTYGGCPTISIAPATLPNAAIGIAYTQTISASGGTAPYTYAVSGGTMPDGLSLDPATGVISGAASAAGTFHFTITATDANSCAGSHTYSLDVHCPVVTISPLTLPSGQGGVAYSQTVTASGGTAPYTFAVTAGSLPGGLSLNATTGVISGTPATLGTFSFTIAATDPYGCAGSRAYTVTISCPTISISPATLPDAQDGVAYNQTVSASGGTPPYTYAVTSESLPSGLTLDPTTGTISGTPAGTGSFPFSITATDALACTRSRSYVLVITSVPCLFCDDFEDGALASDWTYIKPAWSEAGGDLIGTPAGKKAVTAATPAFAGCQVCSVEATISTAGGVGNRIWLMGWYLDKKNTVELMMKQESGKWILKELSNGRTVAKAKGLGTILPNVSYDAIVQFDGTQFIVRVDGTEVLRMTPAAVVSTGTVGFQVKNTTAHFGEITVNP